MRQHNIFLFVSHPVHLRLFFGVIRVCFSNSKLKMFQITGSRYLCYGPLLMASSNIKAIEPRIYSKEQFCLIIMIIINRGSRKKFAKIIFFFTKILYHHPLISEGRKTDFIFCYVVSNMLFFHENDWIVAVDHITTVDIFDSMPNMLKKNLIMVSMYSWNGSNSLFNWVTRSKTVISI